MLAILRKHLRRDDTKLGHGEAPSNPKYIEVGIWVIFIHSNIFRIDMRIR